MKVTTNVEVHTISEYQKKFEDLFDEMEKNLEFKAVSVEVRPCTEDTGSDEVTWATATSSRNSRYRKVTKCKIVIDDAQCRY